MKNYRRLTKKAPGIIKPLQILDSNPWINYWTNNWPITPASDTSILDTAGIQLYIERSHIMKSSDLFKITELASTNDFLIKR